MLLLLFQSRVSGHRGARGQTVTCHAVQASTSERARVSTTASRVKGTTRRVETAAFSVPVC